MKKIKITAFGLLLAGSWLNAQVIITEEANPVATNSSVLLEFGNSGKGIILPSVDSAPGAVGGTFIVNTTDKAVQYFDGSAWVDLTVQGSLVEHTYTNEGTDTGEGVIIGATTTVKPGVLVLESATQAMVLPKVSSPHTFIASPVAGTMVYDTESDALAVYDGKDWSFWAAKADAEPGYVCNHPAPTAVVELVSPVTGRIWMDRNLGASHAATSSDDEAAFGDLYQWGRAADGHQCRNSPTTDVLSNTNNPGHSSFITILELPLDWRSPQNNNLWQGVNGINNPCPSGFRLPTISEWQAEGITNSDTAYSNLKLPYSGNRTYDGSLLEGAFYWSSSVNGIESYYLSFYDTFSWTLDDRRALGFSVRCIKN